MNLYELIEIAQAQTGRTTRMVDHAHNLALDGYPVVLLFPSKMQASTHLKRYLVRYGQAARRNLIFSEDRISVRLTPRCHVFEDHSLVYNNIRARLAELTQWDLPIATEEVNRVGNPLGRVSEIIITREPEACK